MLSQSLHDAERAGRFNDTRRDRRFSREPGNNTRPTEQERASISLRRMTIQDKAQRDSMFAQYREKKDFEGVGGDVQKRSWRFSLRRGSTSAKVREQEQEQMAAWFHEHTMSETASGKQSPPAVRDGKGLGRNSMAETATVVGDVMRQRASVAGAGLTP